MSNVNIYEKNWIDLVFENKNKEYGAYQLRQENEKTTLFALLGGVTFVLAAIGMWLFLSSFGSAPSVKPTDDFGTVITLTDIHPPTSEPFEPKTEKPQTQSQTEPIKFQNMVVDRTSPTNVDVPKNVDIPNNQGTTGTGIGTGTGIDTPSSGGGIPTGTAIIPVVPKGPIPTNELDRLPEYPGGIKNFYEYVGNNFEKPDVDENTGTLSVIMSFVIERDGSMSDVKVLRSSDRSIEREAIRVLKSLKIKWSPGFKDGEKVRVLYTLPIKVAL